MRRIAVVVVALALAGLAAGLWMQNESSKLHGDRPASHTEMAPEDREALRDVLREEGAQ